MKLYKTAIVVSVVLLVGLMLTAPSVDAGLNGTVSGKILTPGEEVLKGVVVTLKSLDGSNPDRIVKSNKKGKYRITNVTPGNYVITASYKGYIHKNSRVVRVSSNGKVRYSLYLEINKGQTVSDGSNSDEITANDETINASGTVDNPHAVGGGSGGFNEDSTGSLQQN